MNETDAVIQRRVVSTEIINRNSSVIKNLNFNHLTFIEENLDYIEKQQVSLMFLLCAADPIQREFFLNELITLSDQPLSKPTDFLKKWATSQATDTFWRNTLTESLCLIQAKHIIFELGLNIDELIGRYLPSNMYVASNIHGSIKQLYKICEGMTVTECDALINYMKKKYPNLENFKYSDNGEYLELHLMHWLSENVIKLGTPDGFHPLIEYFKQNEMDALKEIISMALNQKCNRPNVSEPINGPTNGPTNETQTDDNRNTVIDERQQSIHLLTLRDPNLMNYLIRPAKAGILLIINQRNFHKETNPSLQKYLPAKSLEDRDGTDQDEKRLENIFKALKYNVIKYINLTHSDILMKIDEIVDECKSYDSIFICILSHGAEGVVYGANSIPVKIEAIKHRMISEKLIGKPKVLIIAACQGTLTQRAVPISRLATDGNESSKPAYCDLLTCVASVNGFTSIRHTVTGTWFIQTLCEKIVELGDHMHFLDILTIVHKEVQAKRGNCNECMVPELSSSLGRFLYLPKIDRLMLFNAGELKGK